MRGVTSDIEGIQTPENIPPLEDFFLNNIRLETRGNVIQKISCLGRDDLSFFCRHYNIFELWTKEYIQCLSEYLIQKLSLYKQGDQPIKVLELEAGNGRLSHFLEQEIGNQDIEIITTDTMSDEFKGIIHQDFPVQNMHYQEALDIHKPDVVIVSWMGHNFDCSQAVRLCPSVQEYILIGDDEICGKPWETYGDERPIESTPKYERDGFTKQSLDFLKELQICRTDHPLGEYIRSNTFSFRKKQ